jgi:hypothetical protein
MNSPTGAPMRNTTDILDEVDQFVSGVAGDDEPPPKRRGRKVKALPADISEERESRQEDDEREEDDEEEEETPPPARRPAARSEPDDPTEMLPRDLPRPAEQHRSLGAMMGKYKIGDNPDFRIQLHRVHPKYFPGNVQAHGYLDEFSNPIAEDYIAAEYGGGVYTVLVMGPDPKNPPNGTRRYDSYKVEIAGPANEQRLSRAARAKAEAAPTPPAAAAPTPLLAMAGAPQENTTLASQAMKMAQEQAAREREDRQAAERKAAQVANETRDMIHPLVEAERRRADGMIEAERQRAALERSQAEERIKEMREATRRLEERIEEMNSNRRSPAEELQTIISLIPKGDGGESAAKASEAFVKNLLERQSNETKALHEQYKGMIESIRASHSSEIASLREAQQRELAAEREAGRSRESRHEETLKSEREDRRRDMEMARKHAEDRDLAWKDRLDNQEMNLKSMWESRIETLKSNTESQMNWLRSEIEQKDARIRALEAQVGDRGDIVKQLSSMRDLRQVAKEAIGEESQPSPSTGGGIGLSGAGSAGVDWGEMATTLIENLPALAGMLRGGGAPPGQPAAAPQQQQAPQMEAPQSPPRVGQVVETAQGTMVVVRAPNGELALAPKDAYEASLRSGGTSRRMTSGAKPRGILAPVDKKPMSSGIPVPNMAEGLEKPRPWGEPVQPPMPPPPQQAPTPQQAAPTPQQAAAPARPTQQQAIAPRGRTAVQPGAGGMDATQTLIAREVAKLVHISVENGDEPEEFVNKILNNGYPKLVVDAIASMSDDQVLLAIKTVEPASAGCTPMGQRFVRSALSALRALRAPI